MPQHRAPPFSSKARPSPRGFGDYFVANGWNETKLEYACQTPQMIRWIAEALLDGRDLKSERRGRVKLGAVNGKSYYTKVGLNPFGGDIAPDVMRVSEYPAIDSEFDELSYG